MAEICAFPGIRYNQEKVGDLTSATCPPYDVITPEEQKAYYQKSEYNVVRLEHGMVLPEDTESDNKYTRAKVIFSQWLNEHIMQADPVSSFYIYEHTFSYQNNRKRRLGLIACLRLEPWGSKVVFPHENTASGIKSDRLQLMQACAANFSPLLGLYEDPGQKVTQLLNARMKRKPLIDFTDGVDIHKVWMANEPEFVQRVSHFMAPKAIYIADGHHRYETALAYRDERQQISMSSSSEEAFNFVMTTLVSFSDSGLIALPIHRLVRGLSPEALAGLREHLETFFEIESHPLGKVGLSEVGGATIMVLGLEPGNAIALRLRQSASLDEVMPVNTSGVYRKLDVSIVQHVILGKLLGFSGESDNIAYISDIEQVRKLIDSGQYQLAFLLNSVPVTTIKAIANANDRMPMKSTYFYPKLPTGLVAYRLEGRL